MYFTPSAHNRSPNPIRVDLSVHSRLRNCCYNKEDAYKDKQVVEVISGTFLTLVLQN